MSRYFKQSSVRDALIANGKIQKTLIMCGYPPSNIAGGAIILRNLFCRFPPNSLLVLTAKYFFETAMNNGGGLECKHYLFPLGMPHKRVIGRILKIINIIFIPFITIMALRIVRRNQIDVIFSVPYSGEFFVSAYLVNKITGIPLYVYVLDDWGESTRLYGIGHRMLSRTITLKRILKAASKVWVISKYMQERYERIYNIRCTAMPPAVNLQTSLFSERPIVKSLQDGKNPVTIVYSGAIYGSQLDALQNLVRAIHSYNQTYSEAKLRLELYTPLGQKYLRRVGLFAEWIEQKYVSPEEIPNILQKANLLFLPYSFHGDQRLIVSTSLPTKTSEYLASGTPILVHAPSYSSISQYAREYNWGFVVDQPDPGELKNAIHWILRNQELQDRLAGNAIKVVQEFHDINKVRGEFVQHFLVAEK